ncbi:hypothetical protein Hamer_G011217 [Homarus americanus]|uniref:Uncharacterized protein n=1 Tax=Homarus americanus TaxID=6706 RepID=A0A8J5JXP3_HOMAM|nr:hypothetical protein Hamer_G011217 [Homarus americanus]
MKQRKNGVKQENKLKEEETNEGKNRVKGRTDGSQGKDRWGGQNLAYSGAESYLILRRNPTVFLGGLWFSQAEFYRLWGLNPTVYWGGILLSSGAKSYRFRGGILPLFRAEIITYSRAKSYSILEQNPTIFLAQNSTIFWGKILPSSGVESCPYTEAESYSILGRNPTYSGAESYPILGGISPLCRTEPYHLLGRDPTVFWHRFLPSSGAYSYRILGHNPAHLLWHNPTVFWSKYYRFLGRDSTVFLG